MIKVLIVEDEELAALRMQKMLLEIEPSVQILQITESVEQTVLWLRNNIMPELIFLDIQLSDGISFDIFRHVEIHCPVVFVTAYDSYALQAFEVNSIDYLLKPLRKDLLQRSMSKFNKLNNSFSSQDMLKRVHEMIQTYSGIKNSFKTRFTIAKGNSMVTLKSDEIAYFYIEDKAIFAVTFQNKRHFISYSLEQLEELMNPSDFFRVNRQFFVSIHAIERVHNTFNYKLKLQLKPPCESEIIVSSNKTKEFKNWMEGSI